MTTTTQASRIMLEYRHIEGIYHVYMNRPMNQLIHGPVCVLWHYLFLILIISLMRMLVNMTPMSAPALSMATSLSWGPLPSLNI